MKRKIVIRPTNCVRCDKPLDVSAKGRPRETCSDACRQAMFRQEQAQQPRKSHAPVRVCPTCRTRFLRTNPKRRYCSDKCRAAQWRQTHRNCGHCGKSFAFNPLQAAHRFCTEKCQLAAWDAARTRKTREIRLAILAERVCAGCGGPLELKANSPRNQKYCNDKCGERFRYKLKRTAMGYSYHRRQTTLPVRFNILPEAWAVGFRYGKIVSGGEGGKPDIS
jgi:predicted nucleic acid-binding Zn ribbon protein